MIINSFYRHNQVFACTSNMGVAELSNVFHIEGLPEPVFYFHRIKVRPEFEGTGEGKELMIEVCRYMDQLGGTIYNELNPYGKRNLKSLKSFFKASGFEDYKVEGIGECVIMIRRPRCLDGKD